RLGPLLEELDEGCRLRLDFGNLECRKVALAGFLAGPERRPAEKPFDDLATEGVVLAVGKNPGSLAGAEVTSRRVEIDRVARRQLVPLVRLAVEADGQRRREHREQVFLGVVERARQVCDQRRLGARDVATEEEPSGGESDFRGAAGIVLGGRL